MLSRPSLLIAPLYGLQYESAIKDSYIVLFNYHVDHDDSDDYSIDNHWAHLGQNLSPTDDFVKLKYGYGATVTDAVILEKIRADANVSFVETNREITLC
jgi:hypothetical protein